MNTAALKLSSLSAHLGHHLPRSVNLEQTRKLIQNALSTHVRGERRQRHIVVADTDMLFCHYVVVCQEHWGDERMVNICPIMVTYARSKELEMLSPGRDIAEAWDLSAAKEVIRVVEREIDNKVSWVTKPFILDEDFVEYGELTSQLIQEVQHRLLQAPRA